MKKKKKLFKDRYLILFGLQLTVVSFYYSIITSRVNDKMIEALYYYPVYSICLLTLLGISFGIMPIGYSNLFSKTIFGNKNTIAIFLNVKKNFASNRSIIFLRDSFFILILVIFFIFI